MNEFLLILIAVIVTGAIVGGRANAEIGRWRFWAGHLTSDRDRWRRRCAAAEYALADLEALRRAGEGSCPCLRIGANAWLAGALETVHGELLPGEAVAALTLQAVTEGEAGVVLVSVTDNGIVCRSVHFSDDEGEFVDIDLPAADSPEWRWQGDDGEGVSVG